MQGSPAVAHCSGTLHHGGSPEEPGGEGGVRLQAGGGQPIGVRLDGLHARHLLGVVQGGAELVQDGRINLHGAAYRTAGIALLASSLSTRCGSMEGFSVS